METWPSTTDSQKTKTNGYCFSTRIIITIVIMILKHVQKNNPETEIPNQPQVLRSFIDFLIRSISVFKLQTGTSDLSK